MTTALGTVQASQNLPRSPQAVIEDKARMIGCEET